MNVCHKGKWTKLLGTEVTENPWETEHVFFYIKQAKSQFSESNTNEIKRWWKVIFVDTKAYDTL